VPDQNIQCVDCGTSFPHTERDQAFYAEKGYTPPKRCKPCRAVKKQNRERQDQQRG
jgi:hypothetical protein